MLEVALLDLGHVCLIGILKIVCSPRYFENCEGFHFGSEVSWIPCRWIYSMKGGECTISYFVIRWQGSAIRWRLVGEGFDILSESEYPEPIETEFGPVWLIEVLKTTTWFPSIFRGLERTNFENANSIFVPPLLFLSLIIFFVFASVVSVFLSRRKMLDVFLVDSRRQRT